MMNDKTVTIVSRIDKKTTIIEIKTTEDYKLNTLGDFSDDFMDLMNKYIVPVQFRSLEVMTSLALINKHGSESIEDIIKQVAIEWAAQERLLTKTA